MNHICAKCSSFILAKGAHRSVCVVSASCFHVAVAASVAVVAQLLLGLRHIAQVWGAVMCAGGCPLNRGV